MSRSVVVLMGGVSAEREVSLVSGAACLQALKAAGYDARGFDVGHDIGALLAALTPPPDVVFNALHGRWGEDGCMQGLLELIGLRYTHSGVLASALAMDKQVAKRVVGGAGVISPEGFVVERDRLANGDVMERPYVVKPLREGSSVGVRIVLPGDNAPVLTEEMSRLQGAFLVERYIAGRELTVGVMGDRPLAVTEIRPAQGFYDYKAKYTEGRAVHQVPAQVPNDIAEQAMAAALAAHQALGCRGVSRSDFRYDDSAPGSGRLYYLETNTQPGMTPLSLVPEQASHLGISFEDLCSWMVENAACDS